MDGGDLVYLARTSAGLTQAELGARAGVAQNAVSRIECGQVDAGFSTVRELVRACGLEPQITLSAADRSYTRDVRRLRALTPRARLEEAVRLAHVTQSVRRAAIQSLAVA